MTAAKPVLIISGLDPSGGAGFIADVHVCASLGHRAVGVVATSTVQNTQGLIANEPVAPQLISEQLTRLLSDIPIAAIKIGAIGNLEVARAVADALALTAAPCVFDPVIMPTSGGVPLVDGMVSSTAHSGHRAETILDLLAPHVDLLTPNAAEAAILSATPVDGSRGMELAGKALCERGFPAVLIKGGDMDGSEVFDVLVQGSDVEVFRAPRIPIDEPVHGTGCAFATTAACTLARGKNVHDAIAAARAFVAARLAQPVRAGRGRPSLV